MAKVTVSALTAARMLFIEASAIVAGIVQGDNLFLTRRDGTTFDAGRVRGPKGDKGDTGNTIGNAGGDLTGTYPNPQIANGAINSSKIADASIVHHDIATANRDGLANVPSMRTLGTGPQQAAAGDHTHSEIPKIISGTLTHVASGPNEKTTIDYTNLFPSGYFSAAPNIIICPVSSVPEIIPYYSVSSRTPTGFSIVATRSNTTATTYTWIAMGV